MQKTLLLLLLWCSGMAAFAQQTTPTALPIDSKTSRITISAEMPAPSVSQTVLFSRALGWATPRSTAAKPPRLAMEHNTSYIIFTGTEPMVYPTQQGVVKQPLHYKATISLEEGSYHYRLTDFEVEKAGTPTSPAPISVPVETFLAQNPPADASPHYAYLIRTAFEEASAQLLGTLQLSLTAPSETSASTD